jgi:hypothetical protein
VTGNSRAFRLPMDPNSGALTDVQTGDHVDVMATYSKDGIASTYLIAPDVLVMQVSPPGSANAVQGMQNEGSLLLQVSELQEVALSNALAAADNAPLSSSKTIWVGIVPSHGATWRRLPTISLPGKYPSNGVPTPAK